MIEYFEHELMPGKPLFRCVPLSASLQVTACAGMWEQANAKAQTPERLFRCRGCELGAKHAGKDNASTHALRGSGVCARCCRTDLRLIGGNLCVSCYNRQREFVLGRNGKGQPPVKHPPLERRRVSVLCDGAVSVVDRPLTTSSLELVVETLRDSAKPVFFGLGVCR